MPQLNDLSRSLVALDQDSTIIAVVELSQSSWLVAGVLPGIERQPQKKLEPSAERLLGLLHRWRDEAVRAGKTITRIALAFEAGRDGFWLARWLEARGGEAHVIHPSSVAVSRKPHFTPWSCVTPFALESANQFRPGGPPALTSDRYSDAFDQVKSLGIAGSTTATADEALTGPLREPE